MGDWTHYTATITIENTGDLKPLFFIKGVSAFQKLVESGDCEWHDIEEEVVCNDSFRTAPCWQQFLYECFVPKVDTAKYEYDWHEKMPEASLEYKGISANIAMHPVPCPFTSLFPLDHHTSCLRFYRSVSPDGRHINFTYEGDEEGHISDEHIENWVKCIQECFDVRSGVVVVHRNWMMTSQVWTMGRVWGTEEELKKSGILR